MHLRCAARWVAACTDACGTRTSNCGSLAGDAVYLARQRVANTAAAVQAAEAFAHASALAALAGAAVACRALPPKLNGVVQVRDTLALSP